MSRRVPACRWSSPRSSLQAPSRWWSTTRPTRRRRRWPPLTAVAAPGAHRLGDTLLHIPPEAAGRARARVPRGGRDRGRLRGRDGLLRRRRPLRLRRALPERRGAPVLEPQRRDGHDRPRQPARADPAGVRAGLHRPRLRHRRVQRRRVRGARRRASSTTSSRSPPSRAATARSTAARRPAASPCSRSTAPPTTSSPTAARSPTTPAPSRSYLAGWAQRDGCAGPTRQHPRDEGRHPPPLPRAAPPASPSSTSASTGVDHGWPDEAWGLDTNEAVLRFFAAS